MFEMARHRTLIAIPAYNEVKTIEKVVFNLRNKCPYPIVVFDDGSIDGTVKIAEQAGAKVCCSEINLGYESTINRAFHYAVNMGYSCIIYFDADGEHDPNKIKDFNLTGTQFYAAAGDRSYKNRLSEKFASNLMASRGLSDPYCGMKSYNLEHVNRHIYRKLPGDQIGAGLAYEICINAGMKHFKNIPIQVKHRKDKSRFSSGFVGPNLRIIMNTLKLVLEVRP